MKILLGMATVILTFIYLAAHKMAEYGQEVVPDMSMDWTGQVTKGETDVDLLKH